MEWYYADESDEQVPFDESEFDSLIAQGKITSNTLVWNSGMSDWTKASIAEPLRFVGQQTHGAGAPQQQQQGAAVPYGTGSPGYQVQGQAPGAQPGTYHYPPAAPTDGMAIASLVCGIFGIVLTCSLPGLGVVTGVPAIICGHMSMKRIRESNSQIQGNGMAMAGLITGYIGTAIFLIVLVVIIAGIVTGAFA